MPGGRYSAVIQYIFKFECCWGFLSSGILLVSSKILRYYYFFFFCTYFMIFSKLSIIFHSCSYFLVRFYLFFILFICFLSCFLLNCFCFLFLERLLFCAFFLSFGLVFFLFSYSSNFMGLFFILIVLYNNNNFYCLSSEVIEVYQLQVLPNIVNHYI